MTKAETKNATSTRRAGLALAGATVALGLLPGGRGAAAASGGGQVADRRDDDLLRMCDQHEALQDRFEHDGLDCDVSPNFAVYDANREAILAFEPQTMKGLLAKARVADLEWDWSGECDGLGSEWGMSITRALLRLHGAV